MRDNVLTFNFKIILKIYLSNRSTERKLRTTPQPVGDESHFTTDTKGGSNANSSLSKLHLERVVANR